MALVAGAIGHAKNPSGHRDVDLPSQEAARLRLRRASDVSQHYRHGCGVLLTNFRVGTGSASQAGPAVGGTFCRFITAASNVSLVAALALGAFVALEFLTSAPLVDFRLLGRRNFGLGTLGNFLLGFALYGSAYLLPQYLAVTQGFDAEQSGQVVAWTGLPQLLVIPLVPLLMKRIDGRQLVGLGLLVFAASCFMNLELDRNYAAPQLFWPDVVRALGQAIVMTPISAIAMVGIAPQEAGAASGLFNMMRNLGGAIGTAAVETFFTKREQFHSAIINQHVSLLEPATRGRLVELQQYFMAHGFPDPAGALHRAVIAVGQTIRAEATIMGYADCFALLGVVLVIAVVPVALLRKGTAAGGGAH
jgi:MFS transporter, DHA2 family, multidrug resistance protein